MPEYKMQAEKRAEIQASAVSLNTIHKKVMKTKGGQQLETEMVSFRMTVQTEVELGATREIFDSLFEGGKISTDSQAYAIISAVLTKFNAANGLTGASGGGGGATEQTEANEKAGEAAEKAVKEVKDKPFQARYKSALDSFANTKFQLKLEKLGENPTELEIARAWNNSYASAKDSVEKLIDIANGKAVAEKPKAKSKAKELVKANKMPKANGKRKTEPAMAN